MIDDIILYTGNEDLVKLLIINGADVNQPNLDGQTPLYAPIPRGNPKMVKLLIKNGADVDHMDVQGHSPLHFAASWGNSLNKNINTMFHINEISHLKFRSRENC